MAEETEGKSKKIAVQIPAVSIGAVRQLIMHVHDAAGVPLSRAVLAERLGSTVSSSVFMQKVAAAKYYGFVTTADGGKITITDLGERFIRGDLAAAQEGFVRSAFGDIATGLAGRNVDAKTIALHLTEKRQVPASAAERFARVLIRSAEEAQLKSGNGFSAERLEEIAENIRSGADAATLPPATAGIAMPTVTPTLPLAPGSPANTPKVVLNLNTVPLTLDETLELIRALSSSPFELSVNKNQAAE